MLFTIKEKTARQAFGFKEVYPNEKNMKKFQIKLIAVT